MEPLIIPGKHHLDVIRNPDVSIWNSFQIDGALCCNPSLTCLLSRNELSLLLRLKSQGMLRSNNKESHLTPVSIVAARSVFETCAQVVCLC